MQSLTTRQNPIMGAPEARPRAHRCRLRDSSSGNCRVSSRRMLARANASGMPTKISLSSLHPGGRANSRLLSRPEVTHKRKGKNATLRGGDARKEGGNSAITEGKQGSEVARSDKKKGENRQNAGSVLKLKRQAEQLPLGAGGRKCTHPANTSHCRSTLRAASAEHAPAWTPQGRVQRVGPAGGANHQDMPRGWPPQRPFALECRLLLQRAKRSRAVQQCEQLPHNPCLVLPCRAALWAEGIHLRRARPRQGLPCQMEVL